MLSHFEHIFKPLKIGRLVIKNRIEFPPVGPLLATDGLVSRDLIEWGRSFAKGGAGIVTLGDSAVILPSGGLAGNALNLGTDRAVNPLNKFAETVQRYGARASIQLNHRTSSSPTEMTLDEIRFIIESFAAAAGRCLAAGMDMVLIHGAHGQLISQFFSPQKNRRTDIYGGTLENRARFAAEILEAIRDRVQDRLAIEYRISAEEFVPGGLTIEDQLVFAGMVQDKIDLIHISAGMLEVPETLPRMIQPAYLPRGINVEFAARFKRELQIPVTAVGSLDLEMAEKVLSDNQADMVALARTLIADPDCVNKARRGAVDDIRPCVRCNLCINRTHGQRLPVRCAVNPHTGREAEFVDLIPPARKKKVVVIGGGPAGMEAARTSAQRGHQVVLLEKESSLGGTLKIAAAPPFKTDLRKYVDYAVRSTLKASDLSLRLSTEATPEIVRSERPDAVIVAMGSSPFIPPISGIDRENVLTAASLESGQMKAGHSVVVVGAGLTGSETALWLAQQGKKVTLIDMLPLDEIDAGIPAISITALRQLLKDLNVDTRTEEKLESVTGSGVTVKDKNGATVELLCATVVLSLGTAPRTETVGIFQDLAPDVYFIGDCHNSQGNVQSAVAEGFFAALEI